MSNEAHSLDNLDNGDDKLDDAEAAPNSVPVPREPLPSLGMVAHIWAGHLGAVEIEQADLTALESAPNEASITLPSRRAQAATVE